MTTKFKYANGLQSPLLRIFTFSLLKKAYMVTPSFYKKEEEEENGNMSTREPHAG